MNIFFVGRIASKPRRINLTDRRWLLAGSAVLAAFVVVGGAIGFVLGHYAGDRSALHSQLQVEVLAQRDELTLLQRDARNQMDALAIKLGELEARATRLDALGHRLTDLGQLDDGEFDFSSPPAIGGPIEVASPADSADVELDISSLAARLENRSRQLELLEELLQNRKLDDRSQPAGRPVRNGWMSSRFGPRTDPFTGHQSMHSGVDFSGASGSDILAVGDGVVTWSGQRFGYGLMVEIDHGNGYTTRYAHNKENRVAVGQKVSAGDPIAAMGSSGRSTSTHVHFVVLRDGRKIDPRSYVSAIR